MYFESAGRQNTEKTIELTLRTARERKIEHLVVASTGGDTPRLLNPKGLNVVCVTHAYGSPKPGENDMPEDIRKQLSDNGIKLLTATHVLSGAERGISKEFGGIYPVELIAHTLRMLGQGTKVCVEIAVMALDAGLIPYHTPVIAMGGSGKGADTAVILTPSHANDIFETKIHEYICKPYNV
ncbi:MAG TPA: pyruvate kinase alpha/beta domain-containing protein [Clostridia bacterium]|nr:pyruvate kinase alpha/beta domain-containing protein [Clostridia bacterium]